MSGEVVDPLSDDERTQLAADEAIIEAGFVEFLKVGMALWRIRDSRLYRETHGTFEAYVEKRWYIGRTYAYRLIKSGQVAQLMSPIGDIPPIENEGQARALAPIVKEHGPEAAAETLRAAAEAGPVTARSITEHAPPPVDVIPDGKQLPAPADQIPDDEVLPALADLGASLAHQRAIAVTQYPDLDVPDATDEQIIRVADALNRVPDDERAMRLANGVKWLESRSTAPSPQPADPIAPADKVIAAVNAAAITITRSGGAAAFAESWRHADEFTRDQWRASIGSLEASLNELSSITHSAAIRRIK